MSRRVVGWRSALLLAMLLGLLPALGGAHAAGDGVQAAWVLGDVASAGGGYVLAPMAGPMAVLQASGASLGGRVGEMLPFPASPTPAADPQVFLPLIGN